DVAGPKGFKKLGLTTGENGKIELKNLAAGEYTITEKQPPEGYDPAVPDFQKININNVDGEKRTVTVTFKNPKIVGSITITKVDAANANKKLKDAVFLITGGPEGFEPMEVKTNNQGVAVAKDLPPGTYTITEKQAPDGYEMLNMPIENVVVGKGQQSRHVQVEVKNELIKGSITVTKVDADTGEKLDGAVFDL